MVLQFEIDGALRGRQRYWPDKILKRNLIDLSDVLVVQGEYRMRLIDFSNAPVGRSDQGIVVPLDLGGRANPGCAPRGKSGSSRRLRCGQRKLAQKFEKQKSSA